MLYLNPPFHIINGVSLFPDHADPLQYYYLPLMPKLTQVRDALTSQRVPQLQLLKYRGAAGKGGFLNFDVNIGLEEGTLEDVRARLRQLQRLSAPPRLAPVPVVDGTVKLLLLGRQSGDAPPPTGQPQFVVKVDHAAKPSLYGENQAAFSVQLDESGVTLMEKALLGEMSPIGVVYSLEYLALRPAYSVRLNVNWERVQTRLDETFGGGFLFVSTQIENMVDKLIEERAIVIEADTFVPEGEDSAGIINRRDAAIDQVRDMVTDAFFQPSLNPQREAADGWDKAEHLAKTASAIGATGGWGSLGSFTYKKLNYTRIDRKTLNMTFNERTTVKRTIYPQGHLAGLFRPLKQQGLDLNRFVMAVDLDDNYFKRRAVKVISRADLIEDGIESVNALLKYGDEPQNVILDATKPAAELVWVSQMDSTGVLKRAVSWQYKVNFKPGGSGMGGSEVGAERPISLLSPMQTTDVDNLELQPRELYSILRVPVLALNFPWEVYPTLEVQLRYEDAAQGIRILDSFLLNQQRTEETWKLFVRDPNKTRFEYRLIYRAANLRDLETPWQTADGERLILRDPHPAKRTLQIIPSFNFNEVNYAFVDVAYEDKANNLSESHSYQFNREQSKPETFSVGLKDPNRRLVQFSTMILYHDGRVREIPSSLTLEKRIVVRAEMRGHSIVSISPKRIDFASKKLKRVQLNIRYEDTDNGLHFEDQFEFASPSEGATFEFDYTDSQKRHYSYDATYFFTNGLSKQLIGQRAAGAELFVPAPV